MKTVLLTGCSSGFGYEMALKFARSGYMTFASVKDIKSSGTASLQDIAVREHLPLEIVQIDVTDQQSIDNAISKITSQVESLDILINNAGFGFYGPVEDFSIDEIKEQYDTNILGVIRMVKAVAPVMRKNKKGTVINFSSISGLVSFPLYSIYSSSKFAIETITEGLRFELAHFGINVYLVEPGSFATSFSKNRRMPKAYDEGKSEYTELIETFEKRYVQTHDQNKVIRKVGDPMNVVDRVFYIADSNPRKFRHMLGYDAYKFYILRKLLPFTFWENLLRYIYRW